MTDYVNILVGTITFRILLSLRLRKTNRLDNNALLQIKNHCDEAHPILFFYLLHAVQQTMLNPLVFSQVFSLSDQQHQEHREGANHGKTMLAF
jgi:hypothetical protein